MNKLIRVDIGIFWKNTIIMWGICLYHEISHILLQLTLASGTSWNKSRRFNIENLVIYFSQKVKFYINLLSYTCMSIILLW